MEFERDDVSEGTGTDRVFLSRQRGSRCKDNDCCCRRSTGHIRVTNDYSGASLDFWTMDKE